MFKSYRKNDINIRFILRHKFEKKELGSMDTTFRQSTLGFWYSKQRIVGRKNFSNPKLWSENMVNDYTIGVNLIWVIMWCSFNMGGMTK